jgi:NitT/TauT family transport system permease protein
MKSKNVIYNIFAIVFWIAIWQIISMFVKLEAILPSPVSTLKSLIRLSSEIEFWKSCFLSVLRILIGLFSGAVFAVILAYITYVSKFAYAIFSPVLTVIKATPIASFIILALIWIGREFIPSFITFLIVLPIIWSTVYHSINTVDNKLKEITIIFNFSAAEKLKHLYFPSVFSAEVDEGVRVGERVGKVTLMEYPE